MTTETLLPVNSISLYLSANVEAVNAASEFDLDEGIVETASLNGITGIIPIDRIRGISAKRIIFTN
jgi:hypothetical protein